MRRRDFLHGKASSSSHHPYSPPSRTDGGVVAFAGYSRETHPRGALKVTVRVLSGAYRIDMVVEGAGDTRLAIECDSDEYHGPDRWPHDMNRQRVLERAGWVFWRCFASLWTLRKDDVLAELLLSLTAMGIEPQGAIEHAPSLVEKRVWQMATSENGKADEVTLALESSVIKDQQNKKRL